MNNDMYKAAGIIIKGRKLLVERSYNKQFFIAPGGGIEKGETAKQALVRELKEEFSIDVNEKDLTPFANYSAEAANHPGRTVHMEVFVVKKWQGDIIADSEVEEIRWITSTNQNDEDIGSIFAHEVLPKLKQQDVID